MKKKINSENSVSLKKLDIFSNDHLSEIKGGSSNKSSVPNDEYIKIISIKIVF